MKKLIVKLLILIIILGCVGTGWLYYDYSRFVSSTLEMSENERIIEIPQGAGEKKVAHILAKEGIVEHEWMVRVLFKTNGVSKKIQPGTVVIKSGMLVRDLPSLVARVGDYAQKSVQILAGMNIYEIGARLQTQRIADKKSFVQRALDPALAAEMGIPAQSFEGYIAAGAYTFNPGTTPEEVLAAMHDRWLSQWNKLVDAHRGAYEQALKRVNNDHALVTLASMVEKEAVVAKERPVIARVFYNRLSKKMKLQSDPTCIYPPIAEKEKPSPARCKENSAYSTYVLNGLPPGPITTPSAGSLEAVLVPYNGPDATAILFFVAKQDGSWQHYFSKTYAEHQVAVDYFLKKKKDKKPRGTTQPE